MGAIGNSNHLQHGDARIGRVTRLHRLWRGMLARCNPNHAKPVERYAGRGVRVCDDWLVYENFRAWALAHGYADHLTIERVDNSRHYDPANCCWATRKEQARNRRSTRTLTIDGRSMSVAGWLEERNVTHAAFYGRLSRGWSPIRALGLEP